MKTITKSYPAIYLSIKKIYEIQSRYKYVLLVGTGIDFVVTN